MKRLIIIGLLFIGISGCASIPQGKNYSKMAEDNKFEYYFPSASATHYFANLDEAYDFISAGRVKLETSIEKHYAKGLSAKLNGSTVIGKLPVTVTNFIVPISTSGVMDISKSKDPLLNILKDAISVSNVFMVFYEDKGVSISDFYLKDGYRYQFNSQYDSFKFNGSVYKADYPIGWGIDKAFAYLGK